jgi:hypothetical protein
VCHQQYPDSDVSAFFSPVFTRNWKCALVRVELVEVIHDSMPFRRRLIERSYKSDFRVFESLH